MNAHASYVFSAYSFIHSLPKEQIPQVGYLNVEGSPIPSFDEDLLIKLCEDAKKIFENEENILEISGDVTVVGDIHGSFHDLLRILRYINTSHSKAVFLGDYIDRGNFSLECITLLFALKILKPKQYFLLRGNHEFDEIGSHYGFKKEILDYHNPKKTDLNIVEEEAKSIETQEERCDNYYANHVNINCYKYSEKLYEAFITTFSYLPICSIINKTSICIHGGLTPLLDKVENISKQIQRPITSFDENLLLSDIIWSDPSPNLPQLYSDNQRGRGKLFNGAVVVNFLKHNNLKRLIRGHECVNSGIELLFNEKCITVFSASSYNCNNGNSSGILRIYQQDDKIEPIIFAPLPRLQKCDANYYKVQSFDDKEADESKFSICNHKISEYKSGFLSNFVHISGTHSVQNLRTNFDDAESDNHKNPFHFVKKHKSLMSGMQNIRYGSRLKAGNVNVLHVFKTPHIFTPQMSNHSDFSGNELFSKSESS